MDSEWSATNLESLDQLEAIFTQKKNSGNIKIVVFAGAAISKRAPTCLPDATPMVEATIKVLLDDPVLSKSFQQAGLLTGLYQFFCSSCASPARVIPPEMVYDAIYEYAGEKVFSALECLKSNSPNLNHKILATLLDRGFIDSIVTTNFDSLIEQSLSEVSRNAPSVAKRIWKIHGDIRRPSSMVTTMRRVGQTAFNEDLVKDLRMLLDGSHVIFIGYSGMDPDLMPAFKTANMASVYWCVYRPEELKAGNENSIIDRDPCKTIKKETPIWWILGDLQTELLIPVAERVFDKDTKDSIPLPSNKPEIRKTCESVSPLDASITKWERSRFRRLSPVQKASAVLRILYYIALYSPKPHIAWAFMIEAVNAMEKNGPLSKDRYAEFRRDLHTFQAEAFLQLGELVQQLSREAQAEALLSPGVQRYLFLFKRTEFLKHSVQLDEVVDKIRSLQLDNDGANASELVGQLFVRSKNLLTPLLPLPFRDSAQVQACLHASTILMYLAGRRSEEDESRNLQGALEMLEKGITICDHAKMNPDKKNSLKAHCYSNLAILYSGQDNLVDGLRFFSKAEILFKNSGDINSYAIACINMGLFLMHVYRDYKIEMYKDEATKYYQKAKSTLDSFPNDSLAEALERLARELLEEI